MCQVSRQIYQVSTTFLDKVPKTLKNPKKRNLARNFKRMTIVSNSNRINPIIYQRVLCAKFRGKQTKFEPLYVRNYQKCLKKP